MKPARRAKYLFQVVAFLGLLVAFSACSRSVPGQPPPGAATPTPQIGILKPRPLVADISSSTAGFFEDYYVILETTIKNDGAAGSILVTASLTQADKTSTKKTPVFLQKGENQVERFVFPVKWHGGEWTPKVTVEVP